MKCRVLKQLPFAKVGEEVELVGLLGDLERKVYRGKIVFQDKQWSWYNAWGDPIKDGWLEPKKPVRWSPSDGESYWYATTALVPAQTKCTYGNDEARIALGNAFETEEECAELCLRFKNVLQAYMMELVAEKDGRKADFGNTLIDHSCNLDAICRQSKGLCVMEINREFLARKSCDYCDGDQEVPPCPNDCQFRQENKNEARIITCLCVPPKPGQCPRCLVSHERVIEEMRQEKEDTTVSDAFDVPSNAWKDAVYGLVCGKCGRRTLSSCLCEPPLL